MENATPVPGQSHQDTIPSQEGPAPFTRASPLWINYHQHLFRANGETARLTIELAASASPLLINFIELQPAFIAP